MSGPTREFSPRGGYNEDTHCSENKPRRLQQSPGKPCRPVGAQQGAYGYPAARHYGWEPAVPRNANQSVTGPCPRKQVERQMHHEAQAEEHRKRAN